MLYSILFAILYIIASLVFYKTNKYISNVFLNIIYMLFEIFGIIICFSIIKKFKNIKVFDIIKKYTFEIYLTHTIFVAGMRILLLKINITNYLFHFIVGMVSSIVFPIIMSKISKKIGYTEFFFYPTKTIKKYKTR